MADPEGNSEFCFSETPDHSLLETLNVPRGKAQGNIEDEGKQNSLFPAGQAIKCLVIPPNSNNRKKTLRKKSFA